MRSKQYLSKITALFLSVLLMYSGTAVYASEDIMLSEHKSFSAVFYESISTEISDISYGMICYPSKGINCAAEIETEDLLELINAYKNAEGVCILAPQGYDYLAVTGERDTESPYFYIGVSSSLPKERRKWFGNVKMSMLCFGGNYGGAVMYGGYGIVESDYGKEYPPALPINFVWYKPFGEQATAIEEIASDIYTKYKDKAKPFGDYDGTKDEQYFSGCDETFETQFKLPQCFTADGCSEWAYDSLHKAAKDNLIPYNTSHNYKEPVTRSEFCALIANILNMAPVRQLDDIFANPNSYTVLREKASSINADIENVSYSDMDEIDESVRLLSAIGIVNGTGDNMFNPNEYITREQICTILQRMIKLYPNEFDTYTVSVADENFRYSDDNLISDWAKESVYSVSKYGFVNGTGHNNFSPQEYCTLEQAITIISRMAGIGHIKS